MSLNFALTIVWELCLALGCCLLAVINFFRQFIAPKRKDVRGEIVVITGAGSGIGRLLSVEFARLGAVVVAWDVNQRGLDGTVEEVKRLTGETIYAYECDVGSSAAVERVAAAVTKEVGVAGILINNAGVVNGSTLLNTSNADIERTFRVNTLAHFYTVKAFLPGMLARGRGHLVFMASCAGMLGAARATDYCASKAANLLMADSLAFELENCAEQRNKVAITTVAPFLIRTGMFEGVTSSIPGLVPDLEPEYVAQRVTAAVLAEQSLVAIPRAIYFFALIHAILPVAAQLHLDKITGGSRMMETFRGRPRH